MLDVLLMTCQSACAGVLSLSAMPVVTARDNLPRVYLALVFLPL